MELKRITAYGFKSFADKIEINVRDGITGIVGPNGSGKSNIVDAVKWVLGEQSVKALRGSSAMSDVIFQGSASRKPLTRASVSLVFSNEDHYLNSDYKEIEIKRVVYSSGENEYTINGSKVRLKDITDLFLDSGAGKEAFSIISQGKIGEIVSSKPEDRRAIIEEAAGVLKYKKRKLEALRKLEKTNDNIQKVDLVINEISTNLEPLRIDSEKAKKYTSFKEELESIEVALLVSDITKLNDEYDTLKKESETLNEEIEKIDSTNFKGNADSEKLKLELLKLEEEINSKSQKVLEITEELSKIEANKQVLTERKKFEVDDAHLASNIIDLRENILKLENNLKTLDIEIKNQEEKVQKLENRKESLLVDYRKAGITKNNLTSEISLNNRMLNDIKNKIDISTSNIENDTLLPYSVKSVLNNPRLKGLRGTIGNLIDVSDTYTTAIDTVLGFNQNVIVCDNETSAKEAILYLKNNNLGRATFFPMNIIKGKHVDSVTISKISADKDYLGVASSLVSFQSEFENIVTNQLGNVLVVKDINAMNRIGKIINYSYRVVTLDGEILHSGGSMTGGAKKTTSKNSLSEKNILEGYKRDYNKVKDELENKNARLDSIDKELEILLENLNSTESELVNAKETLKQYMLNSNSIKVDLSSKEEELKGNENMQSGSLDKALDEAISAYYAKENEKNELTTILDNLKSKKSDLNTEINEIELENRKANSEYNKKISTLKDIEVRLGKLDIKLDNMLLRLTDEYDMTYERAKQTYDINEVTPESRDRVQTLRRNIKELGEVNIGAISEYERINTRYEFLTSQKIDLKNSTDELLGVINEMDEAMEKDFKSAYEKVNAEFKKVFNQLFKGGHGEIVLTDPDNLLETGVDIIAEPPGKKLKNINLLSGGEKTLTAISLLFAILNVKVVPFCILDEVEAALDEANVDTFGTYLKEYEHKTQFIVITHKKKTMEYANTLYGITMQESGVSKLVSVKLENIEN